MITFLHFQKRGHNSEHCNTDTANVEQVSTNVQILKQNVSVRLVNGFRRNFVYVPTLKLIGQI
jgi:hypothetical protein